MAIDRNRLEKRLTNLRDEYRQLSIRARAQETVIKKNDGKDPDKWHQAVKAKKRLDEKLTENLRRQNEITRALKGR